MFLTIFEYFKFVVSVLQSQNAEHLHRRLSLVELFTVSCRAWICLAQSCSVIHFFTAARHRGKTERLVEDDQIWARLLESETLAARLVSDMFTASSIIVRL